MPHEILPAQAANAPEILALQRLAYQAEARLYGDWSIPPLTQTLEELSAEFARLTILKAQDANGRIVGSVRAEMDNGVCRIGRLMVHPDAQRQGRGAALLAAVEAAFPKADRYALFTGSKSEGNLRLYRRLGYVETARRKASPAVTLVFLEKPGPAQP